MTITLIAKGGSVYHIALRPWRRWVLLSPFYTTGASGTTGTVRLLILEGHRRL